MRVLLLFRGAPGCGKSTWIKEHGLEEYTLSPDNLRVMCQSPVLTKDGAFAISQSNEKKVWNILFQLLEDRMQRGEFTVIDATNSKTSEMNRYKTMAESYRYRVYIIDMTQLPIEECKRRNKMRDPYKVVPEEAIDKMYARFETQKIPGRIQVLPADDVSSMWYRKADFSKYKKIHHIGDIHGCATPLKECLKDFNPDELYIFLGDFIDRGIENAEVVKMIAELSEKDNVLLLEGNHERWLWAWGHDQASKSPEFEKKTRRQLNEAGLDPMLGRKLYRKLGQCAYYVYGDKTVFACHAGISRLPENLTLISTEQMIKGSGQYADYETVALSFEKYSDENTYQIFGHRNTAGSPVHLTDRCFNLEGGVEFGGCLREAILSEDGWEVKEYKNEVYAKQEEIDTSNKEYNEAEQSLLGIVDDMRKNKYIVEKKYGNVSSFNFTRDAFYKSKWDEMTTKARGLFINTVEGRVVARSYDKFFNYGELYKTKPEALRFSLKFPVTAYRKENGFLALLSYDKENDDLFIASKSTPDGPFALLAREIILKNTEDVAAIKEYLKKNDVTFVFECIDPVNDPHIIKYDKAKVVLLDIVNNTMSFEKYDFERLKKTAGEFGYEHKKKSCVIESWPELVDWMETVSASDYKDDGEILEGYVIEDQNGFMFKLKLSYYKFWKQMRGVAQSVLKSGNYRYTGSLTDELSNRFYGWCKSKFKILDSSTDIITLRDMFFADTDSQIVYK